MTETLSLEKLMTAEIQSGFGDPVPAGRYLGVITNIEVRTGGKGEYLSVEVTIHQTEDGDDGQARRKTWGISSYSENALLMPAGLANLLQATRPTDLKSATPNAVATKLVGYPVGVEIGWEQVKRNGVLQIDVSTGEPEMRHRTTEYFEAPASFADGIDKESAGVNDDLPF